MNIYPKNDIITRNNTYIKVFPYLTQIKKDLERCGSVGSLPCG